MDKHSSFLLVLAAPLLLCALPAHAALRVFACEPEWGAHFADELERIVASPNLSKNVFELASKALV